MNALALIIPALILAAVRESGAQEKADPAGASRTVVAKDGQTVTVKARVAEAGKNFLTVLALPDAVAHVVSSWDAKDLSLEQEGSRLFIKLLAKAEGFLDVVTTGGLHVRFFLVGVAAPGAFDSTIVVRIGGGEAPAPSAPAGRRGGSGGALELAKAMRLGDVPPDATVRSGGNEDLLRMANLEAKLHYVYETARYRGYVLGLANLSLSEAYHLDVRRFGGEALVLVGAKDVVIPPGKSTRLYVVDWK